MNYKLKILKTTKKIILIAVILVAGVANAKTGTPENGNDRKSQNKKEVISENKEKSTLTTKALKELECNVFYASCTAAYTCQDWTPQQWYDWAYAIQQNYCQLW